jgi:hypothetical protein
MCLYFAGGCASINLSTDNERNKWSTLQNDVAAIQFSVNQLLHGTFFYGVSMITAIVNHDNNDLELTLSYWRPFCCVCFRANDKNYHFEMVNSTVIGGHFVLFATGLTI